MPLHTVACDAGHRLRLAWIDLLLHRWTRDFRCPNSGCQHRVKLRGRWQPPRARPDDARENEVVYVAYLDEDAPNGDRWMEEHYLPVLIVCEAPPGSGEYSVWPRYWVRPGATPQFGQDGPLLSLAEWQYLMAKVQRFLQPDHENDHV